MPSLLDSLNKTEKLDSGGGYTGRVRLDVGYKIFIKGLDNKESFVPFDPEDADAQKKALIAARAISTEHDPTRKPKPSVQITIYRDDVIGRDVTWQDDRIFTYPTYTDGYKQVIKPALEGLAEQNKPIPSLGVDFWGRVSFIADPGGRTKKDQNGEEVPELIAYIADVFPSKNAALAFAVGAGSEEGGKTTQAPGSDDPFTQMKDDADFLATLKTSVADLQKPLKGTFGAKQEVQQNEAIKKIAAEWISDDAAYVDVHLEDLRKLAGL